MPITLGDKVRDLVTGLTGVATSRTVWLNGCVRFGVEYLGGREGEKRVDRETFDEEQLEVVEANAVVPLHIREAKKAGRAPRQTGGGGRPDPPRNQVKP